MLDLLPFMAAKEKCAPLVSPPLEPPFFCPFLSLPAGRRGDCVKSACFTKSHSALWRAVVRISGAVGGRLTGFSAVLCSLFPLTWGLLTPCGGWGDTAGWKAPPVACKIQVCPAHCLHSPHGAYIPAPPSEVHLSHFSCKIHTN